MSTDLMSPQELAEYLAVPVGTIYQWNYSGRGPRFSKIGKHVRYRRADVDAWIEQHACDHDAA